MPRETVTIEWADGRRVSAQSWSALLEKIRRDQWQDMTTDEFRMEMEKRAWVWSSTQIAAFARPKTFFEELERAMLLRVIRREK